MEKYMQMTSLKTNYREKQTQNSPADLQPFQRETPTQVFSCGIYETFKSSGGCF